MSSIKIACSPITGRIFAGTLNKNGSWSKNKVDVTSQAVFALVEHIIKQTKDCEDKTIVLQRPDGTKDFEITLKDLRS